MSLMIKTLSPQIALKSTVKTEGPGSGSGDKLANSKHPHSFQSREYPFNKVEINIHYHPVVPWQHVANSCEGLKLYNKVHHNDNRVKHIII
jgi:hypothetical protein